MYFHEKLDFLMNITNINNSMLARSIPVDPSFISRLRTGIRIPSKKENYIDKFSYQFAKAICTDYQKSAISETIGINQQSFPSDITLVQSLLNKWLKEIPDTLINNAPLDSSLEDFSFKEINNSDYSTINIKEYETAQVTILYGDAGKKLLFQTLIDSLIKASYKDSLLILDEGDFNWFTGDETYKETITSLLIQVLKKGHNIKIIHTLSRPLNDLFAIIEVLLTLNLAGTVESYYYPKVRDGLLQTTMFLAPRTAGIHSTHYKNNNRQETYFYVTDYRILHHLYSEFQSYQIQCRSLIQTYPSSHSKKKSELQLEFYNRNADTVFKSACLGDFCISQATLDNMSAHTFTQLITLPNIEDIIYKNPPLKTNTDDCLSFPKKEELISHLKVIVNLLKNHPNYVVRLLHHDFLPGYYICVKKDVGILIQKEYDLLSPANNVDEGDSSNQLIVIKEPSLSHAIWDYILSLTNPYQTDVTNRNHTIAQLEWYIQAIDN